MGTGTDGEYEDGRRAVWREILAQAVAALGLDDDAARVAAWALERREVEAELRELWFSFVIEYGEDGRPTHEDIPYPEGASRSEALRRFGEYL